MRTTRTLDDRPETPLHSSRGSPTGPSSGIWHAACVGALLKFQLMRGSDISVSGIEDGEQPSVEDLCKAMFIEGTRVLGFQSGAKIPLEAQEKILLAVNALATRLALLLHIQGED